MNMLLSMLRHLRALTKRQREAMLAFAAASGEDVKGVKKTVLDKLRDAFEDK